jgi:hypothetical protein
MFVGVGVQGFPPKYTPIILKWEIEFANLTPYVLNNLLKKSNRQKACVATGVKKQ